ncbi:SPOCS domain-containing protein [Inediibacterium massiliense]|uniref:SPOCS domain-containing protein n=1 Tax=Inediibacterium massiliense TaxID=1658111 RepID=UPI0006B3FDE4|nr:SPOCS domain-containing protein [Inediibacterium massiliense]
MGTKVYDLIAYSGLADTLPDYSLRTNPTFKEINVDEMLQIPEQKPDIEQIIRVIAKANILCTKIIETPVSVDATTGERVETEAVDGTILTGYKVGVLGKIDQKIEYVADEETQSVHSAHFSIPFCAHIVLPLSFTPDQGVKVIPYIEDIYALQCDNRNIFKNVTILLDVLIGN